MHEDFFLGPDPENYNSKRAIFMKCLIVSLGDLFNGFCWTLYNNFFDVVKTKYDWSESSFINFMKGGVNSFYLGGALISSILAYAIIGKSRKWSFIIIDILCILGGGLIFASIWFKND